MKERVTGIIRDDRGFALLLVIWVLALVAVLAASVAGDSASQVVIARNRLDAAEASVLAESGVNRAILHLIDPNPAMRWIADGRTEQFSFAEGSVVVTVQDEGGKLDLNAAPIDFVEDLGRQLGLKPSERAALISGIEARRRAVETQGEEAAGPAFAPAYAGVGGAFAQLARQAFADVSELRLLSGMTDSAYDRLEPYVTVDSDMPTVDPRTASRAALLAVPGISLQDVNFYLKARGRNAASIEKPDLSGVDRYVRAAAPHAVSITAVAVATSGARFTRKVVVDLSPSLPVRPYRIIRWR